MHIKFESIPWYRFSEVKNNTFVQIWIKSETELPKGTNICKYIIRNFVQGFGDIHESLKCCRVKIRRKSKNNNICDNVLQKVCIIDMYGSKLDI